MPPWQGHGGSRKPEKLPVALNPLRQGRCCDHGAHLVGPVVTADLGSLLVDAALIVSPQVLTGGSPFLAQATYVRGHAACPATPALHRSRLSDRDGITPLSFEHLLTEEGLQGPLSKMNPLDAPAVLVDDQGHQGYPGVLYGSIGGKPAVMPPGSIAVD